MCSDGIEGAQLLAQDIEMREGCRRARETTTRGRDSHQARFFRHIERPEQHRVRHRENRDVGADAQHQRDDRHRSKSGPLPQIPQRVANVQTNASRHGFKTRCSS